MSVQGLYCSAELCSENGVPTTLMSKMVVEGVDVLCRGVEVPWLVWPAARDVNDGDRPTALCGRMWLPFSMDGEATLKGVSRALDVGVSPGALEAMVAFAASLTEECTRRQILKLLRLCRWRDDMKTQRYDSSCLPEIDSVSEDRFLVVVWPFIRGVRRQRLDLSTHASRFYFYMSPSQDGASQLLLESLAVDVASVTFSASKQPYKGGDILLSDRQMTAHVHFRVYTIARREGDPIESELLKQTLLNIDLCGNKSNCSQLQAAMGNVVVNIPPEQMLALRAAFEASFSRMRSSAADLSDAFPRAAGPWLDMLPFKVDVSEILGPTKLEIAPGQLEHGVVVGQGDALSRLSEMQSCVPSDPSEILNDLCRVLDASSDNIVNAVCRHVLALSDVVVWHGTWLQAVGVLEDDLEQAVAEKLMALRRLSEHRCSSVGGSDANGMAPASYLNPYGVYGTDHVSKSPNMIAYSGSLVLDCGRAIRQKRTRWFVLFKNGMLNTYRGPESSAPLRSWDLKHCAVRCLPTGTKPTRRDSTGTRLQLPTGTSPGGLDLEIQSPGGDVVVITASDSGERDSWARALQAVMQSVQQQKKGSVVFRIEGASLERSDDGSTFAMYSVRVTPNGYKSYIIRKRFSQFMNLHKTLTTIYPRVDFPHSAETIFKKTWGSGTSSTLVNSRTSYLQAYLNFIAVHPVLSRDSYMLRFFDV